MWLITLTFYRTVKSWWSCDEGAGWEVRPAGFSAGQCHRLTGFKAWSKWIRHHLICKKGNSAELSGGFSFMFINSFEILGWMRSRHSEAPLSAVLCCSPPCRLQITSASIMHWSPDIHVYLGARNLIENHEIYISKYLLRIHLNTGCTK